MKSLKIKPPIPAPRTSQESAPSTNQSNEEKPPLPVRPRREKTSVEDNSGYSQTEGLSNPPETVETLREFSRRKNFTDIEINRALERTTLPVDTNHFLSLLISVKAESSDEHAAIIPNLPTNQGTTRKGGNENLKDIVIDGSNIAMTHGNGKLFSSRGIQIAVDWFRQRGHKKIKVFVPDHRKEGSHVNRDVDVLYELSAQSLLIFTPSVAYDDRFILKYASEKRAVVVSNDQYRDLARLNEDPCYRETINQRRLTYTFINDNFMPSEDPMGKRGPTLAQFLRVDAMDANTGKCPYGRKCTYGTKCKYSHEERSTSAISSEELEKTGRKHLPQTIHGSKMQNNNSIMAQGLNTSPGITRAGGYSLNAITEFSNHPGNIAAMPILVSRDTGCGMPQPDRVLSDKPSGPQIIPLRIDSRSYPPPNLVQQTNPAMNGYAPHHAYPRSFPPYNNQHPTHINVQCLPSNFSERVTPSRIAVAANYHREQLNGSPSSDFTNPSHPRYDIYFHFTKLFDEGKVRKAMMQLPNETDTKKIGQLVMQM